MSSTQRIAGFRGFMPGNGSLFPARGNRLSGARDAGDLSPEGGRAPADLNACVLPFAIPEAMFRPAAIVASDFESSCESIGSERVKVKRALLRGRLSCIKCIEFELRDTRSRPCSACSTQAIHFVAFLHIARSSRGGTPGKASQYGALPSRNLIRRFPTRQQ